MKSRYLLSTFLVGLVAVVACKKKTDAQRAAEERAEVKRKLTDSLELMPYVWIKVTMRSNADPAVVGPVRDAMKLIEEANAIDADLDGAKKAAALAVTYAKLGRALYKGRKELQKRDEDTYPLLWQAWTGEPQPWSWYDNGAEHLGLGALWLAGSMAAHDLRERAIIFYELSRADVACTWPVPLQLAALLARGIAYTNAGYHYAAEEELTRFIATAEALPVPEREPRSQEPRSTKRLADLNASDVILVGRSAGYFVRAWNRLGLDRNDQATDDVEKGLSALEQVGIENELTHWGWTFVHLQRGRIEKAGVSLGKLAESPYLHAEARAELRDSAKTLQEQGDATGFFSAAGKAKAGFVIGSALLARVGGVRGALALLLGQRAPPIVAELDRLTRLRTGVAEHVSVDGGIDAAKKLGGKGLDLLEKKLKAEDEP
jgi:tetratricopeptide (TPR) repeat protein